MERKTSFSRISRLIPWMNLSKKKGMRYYKYLRSGLTFPKPFLLRYQLSTSAVRRQIVHCATVKMIKLQIALWLGLIQLGTIFGHVITVVGDKILTQPLSQPALILTFSEFQQMVPQSQHSIYLPLETLSDQCVWKQSSYNNRVGIPGQHKKNT